MSTTTITNTGLTVSGQNNKIDMYQRISDPISAIEKLGAMIAASGIFGCTKLEQGQVFAMQCMSEGKPPLEMAKTYHVIDGKLSMRADAMLAKFQMSGGTVKWTRRDDKEVTAIFSIRGNELPFSAKLEDFIKSGVAVGRDGKNLKDNWRKFTRQMLTARVISEAVRLLAPEIVFGVYTPEEMADTAPTTISAPDPVTSVEVEVVTAQQEFNHVAELERILEQHEESANKFLLAKNYIKEGQTFRDIEKGLAERIIKSPKLFINQATSK